MEKFIYKRGSEWRRWDLHIHTPETLKNDEYQGGTVDEKWEKYCNDINSSDAEISVIGITDYLLIDNYKKFLFHIEQGKITKKFDLILPNIELRLTPVTGSGSALNLHLIIDPSFIDQIDQRIYAKLVVKNGTTQYTALKSDLVRLGRTIDPSYSEQIAYKEGAKQFVIDFDTLKAVFDNDPDLKKHCLVVVSNSTGDGATGIVGHSKFFTGSGSDLDVKRQSVYKFVDAIFSATPSDRVYFLGKSQSDSKEVVIRKCGSLKPCIHGCDAHNNEKIFNPDQHRYCWMKADPTFEGLKQVVYEPEDRVCIQEIRPEEKSSYQIIDKVSFDDGDFASDDILINQNLTVIIGGKSTGKSILLRNIARTIDPGEVVKRLGEVDLKEYKRQVNGFNVIWADLQKNKKDQVEDSNKRIVYIPQSYLNRLIDKPESQTSIDEIIKSVLEQDAEVKKTFDEIKEFERENEKGIVKLIDDIFFLQEDIESKKQEIKDLGDKIGIESEVERLRRELILLKKNAGIEEGDIKRYDELRREIMTKLVEKDAISRDLTTLNSIKDKPIFSVISFADLSISAKEQLEKEFSIISKDSSAKWITVISQQIALITKKLDDKKREISEQLLLIDPLTVKVKASNTLSSKVEELQAQEAKLKSIVEQEKELEEIRKNLSNTTEEIVRSYGKYYGKLFETKSTILNQQAINGDLSFDLRMLFKSIAFKEQFVETVLDGRKVSHFKDAVNLENYTAESNVQHDQDIKAILQGILSGQLSLKNGFSKKEAVVKLTKKWWVFDYKILQDGDEISQMSQGKKSFVLLKLLIELDNSECPILLDQPEDDLDNRSIYHELVKFIKEKKKKRQIIIATHNPNLVVGADAELVIVANQNGEKTKNTREIQFEYVEGALENTFEDPSEDRILYKQGIQEHVCDVLEGGKEAFDKRKSKYNFSNQ